MRPETLVLLAALTPLIIAAILVKAVGSRLDSLVRKNILAKGVAARIKGFIAAIAYLVAALVTIYMLTGVHEALYAAIAASILAAVPFIPLASNAIAYYVMLTEHVIAPGERIRIDGYEGTIHSISLFSTTIRTAEGEYIVIPNRRIMDGIVQKLPATRHKVELEVVVRGVRGATPDETVSRIESILDKLRRLVSEYRGAIRGLEATVQLEGIVEDAAVYRVTFYTLGGGVLTVSKLLASILEALSEYRVDVRIRRR